MSARRRLRERQNSTTTTTTATRGRLSLMNCRSNSQCSRFHRPSFWLTSEKDFKDTLSLFVSIWTGKGIQVVQGGCLLCIKLHLNKQLNLSELAIRFCLLAVLASKLRKLTSLLRNEYSQWVFSTHTWLYVPLMRNLKEGNSFGLCFLP